MTPTALLERLHERGVELWADPESGRIRCRAPRGVVTEAVKAALRENAARILPLLPPLPPPVAPAEITETDEDAAYIERIQALYLAARAGSLPLNVEVEGWHLPDPNAWVLAAVKVISDFRDLYGAGTDYYERATVDHREGLDDLALWWERKRAPVLHAGESLL